MPHWLKRGMDAGAIKAADAKVRETVEGILAQVDDRKDAAIRDLSKKFDNWEPKDFHLSSAEIERTITQVPKRDLDDIKFAQAQVRNFAQKQKETIARRALSTSAPTAITTTPLTSSCRPVPNNRSSCTMWTICRPMLPQEFSG